MSSGSLSHGQEWGKVNRETKGGRDGRREGETEGRNKRKKGANFPRQENKKMNHQGEMLTSHTLDQCKKEIEDISVRIKTNAFIFKYLYILIIKKC